MSREKIWGRFRPRPEYDRFCRGRHKLNVAHNTRPSLAGPGAQGRSRKGGAKSSLCQKRTFPWLTRGGGEQRVRFYKILGTNKHCERSQETSPEVSRKPGKKNCIQGSLPSMGQKVRQRRKVGVTTINL